MRQFETTKLFYDRYKYKVVMLNAMGHIFKKKKMSQARGVLDALQSMQDNNEALVLSTGFRKQNVTPEVFLENKRLFKAFSKTSDYKVRVERTLMTIYSNDLLWLKTVCKIAESPIEFWAPKEGTEKMLEETNVILTRQPSDFEYKLTLSTTAPVDPGLATWIRNNPDKAKASDNCLEIIERKEYPRGQYIYIRDEKVLRLISFMIDRMGRIDKLVYVDDEDK